MIQIRKAKLTEMSAILDFAARQVPDTNYARFPFNSVIARRALKRTMTDPDSRVWIAVRDGRIVGLLMVTLGDMLFTHYQAATDTIFLAEAGGDLLLDEFIAWCKLRKVARIDMGISAGPGRDKAVRRAMRRKGFEHSGSMFHLHLGDAP